LALIYLRTLHVFPLKGYAIAHMLKIWTCSEQRTGFTWQSMVTWFTLEWTKGNEWDWMLPICLDDRLWQNDATDSSDTLLLKQQRGLR